MSSAIVALQSAASDAADKFDHAFAIVLLLPHKQASNVIDEFLGIVLTGIFGLFFLGLHRRQHCRLDMGEDRRMEENVTDHTQRDLLMTELDTLTAWRGNVLTAFERTNDRRYHIELLAADEAIATKLRELQDGECWTEKVSVVPRMWNQPYGAFELWAILAQAFNPPAAPELQRSANPARVETAARAAAARGAMLVSVACVLGGVRRPSIALLGHQGIGAWQVYGGRHQRRRGRKVCRCGNCPFPATGSPGTLASFGPELRCVPGW